MNIAANASPALSSDAAQAFGENVSGAVLLPGAAAYDEARAVWNGMIDRSPAVIVQPKTNEDVIAAVKFAGDHNLPVSIRGGGHNVAGHAVADGCVGVDTVVVADLTAPPTAEAGPEQFLLDHVGRGAGDLRGRHPRTALWRGDPETPAGPSRTNPRAAPCWPGWCS